MDKCELTMYDFHDSTDTLKFWTEKRAIYKTFFVFHQILMQLLEIVVHMDNYNFTKFHQNQMKNKKVLLMAHFSVQNFKVSVESRKSYIVLISFDYYYRLVLLPTSKKKHKSDFFEEIYCSSFLPSKSFLHWLLADSAL